MRFLSLILCFFALPVFAQDLQPRCAALGAAYNMALGLRDTGLAEAEVIRQVGSSVPASAACHLNRIVRRAMLSHDRMGRETEAVWIAECVAREPALAVCS